MNLNRLAAFAAAALLAAGCANTQRRVTLDTVGPGPAPIASTAATGTLLVYSGYQVNADFNRRDAYRPEYSDYDVVAADGITRQHIRNQAGGSLQRPQPVELPPGNYRLVARASNYGIVSVPAQIVVGKTTVIHLDGGNRWADPSLFNETNAVRLPGGDIVGWKTTAVN